MSDKFFHIEAPLSGTFYTSPSPDDPPFVEKGQEVGPDDVVCIVESMKVFTEVRAERKGVIRKCLVENEDPVMIHQPLYEVEPA
jgi:acetyl-CoA carboxylase biotin carboxyl carrier protein